MSGAARAQSARPLRALAAMMAIYVGGRLAVAAYYPEIAVLGLNPAAGLLAARATPARAGPDGSLVAMAMAYTGRSGDFRLMPIGVTEPPIQPRYAALFRVTREGRAMLASARPVEAAMARPVALRMVVPDASQSPAPALVQAGTLSPSVSSGGATPVLPVSRERGRALSGSAWLLLRDGSRNASLAPGGTLGGSQAGARLNWRPTATPVFLTVRASAALATRDSEIAPGIGVRGRAVGVILEQRLPLERGRSSRTALVAYGGVDGVPAPLGFRLDGYAQGGAVGVSDPALFVDGAARAERAVAGVGRARLGLGAAAWGAAQPGIARVDVGPQAVLHLPLGTAGARLSAEYRFRVAGKARPADGVSLTLGADF